MRFSFGCLLAFLWQAVYAADRAWNLKDVKIGNVQGVSPRGHATGSFVYDSISGNYSNITVIDPDGVTLSDYIQLASSATNVRLVQSSIGDLTDSYFLELAFNTSLPDQDGTVCLGLGETFEGFCKDSNCTTIDPWGRLVGGFVASGVTSLTVRCFNDGRERMGFFSTHSSKLS
jgi:hypothetical protein